MKYDAIIHDLERTKTEVKVLEHEMAEVNDDATETREILR